MKFSKHYTKRRFTVNDKFKILYFLGLLFTKNSINAESRVSVIKVDPKKYANERDKNISKTLNSKN